ncbi:unnamed protein product [Arctia plantaginis]|uniref:Hymenoptaecin n=1 Tax=Arctia plantaginis TaxID=874455 RepID=A0A8S1B3J4_ARCPL|nr:unnamed protein product [Arctia plantaginis]
MKWVLILVLSVLAIAMATPQRGSGNARPDRVLVTNNNGGFDNTHPDRVLVADNNGGYGNTRPDRGFDNTHPDRVLVADNNGGYGNTRPDRVLVTNNNGGGLQRPVILPERLPNIPQATGVPREGLRDSK